MTRDRAGPARGRGRLQPRWRRRPPGPQPECDGAPGPGAGPRRRCAAARAAGARLPSQVNARGIARRRPGELLAVPGPETAGGLSLVARTASGENYIDRRRAAGLRLGRPRPATAGVTRTGNVTGHCDRAGPRAGGKPVPVPRTRLVPVTRHDDRTTTVTVAAQPVVTRSRAARRFCAARHGRPRHASCWLPRPLGSVGVVATDPGGPGRAAGGARLPRPAGSTAGARGVRQRSESEGPNSAGTPSRLSH